MPVIIDPAFPNTTHIQLDAQSHIVVTPYETGDLDIAVKGPDSEANMTLNRHEAIQVAEAILRALQLPVLRMPAPPPKTSLYQFLCTQLEPGMAMPTSHYRKLAEDEGYDPASVDGTLNSLYKRGLAERFIGSRNTRLWRLKVGQASLRDNP